MNLVIAPPQLKHLPVDIIHEPLEKLSTITDSMGIRLALRFLDVEDGDLRLWLEMIGELKTRSGKRQLEPGRISKSRFANWMAGKPPMALWRLGAAVATLEWIALEKTALYLAHDLAGDDPRVKSLGLAIDVLRKFRNRPGLNAWIWIFRWAIFRRLEVDARRDTTAAVQLSRYSSLLAEIQIEEKEHAK